MACFPNRPVQDVRRPLIARHPLDDVDSPEGGQRPAAGLAPRQSPLDVLGGLPVEMKPELGVQFALEPAPPEESTQAVAQRRKPTRPEHLGHLDYRQYGAGCRLSKYRATRTRRDFRRGNPEEMKFAIAQVMARDTVEENLRDHCRLLDIAAQHRADLIVFPEMSMTGYTREKAAELAFDVDDARLDPLKSTAAAQHIVAVAGAPVRMNGALHIGSFILFPDHSTHSNGHPDLELLRAGLEHGIRRQKRVLVTAGELVGALQANEPGLLLVEKAQGSWSCEAVPFSPTPCLSTAGRVL
ncbi:MAG: carbon-nitrogen hydrolase family protein [Acidobacteria bacterium]|nr:carbon-nitrogen hydrolase family protein [Acidobacteriota bacterium]